jgi:hypothetical protein
LGVAEGGSGTSTTPTDGQLLIGNSSTNKYSLSTITAGSNITVTNGHGTITIASTGGGGSTLSVAVKTTNYTMTNSDDVVLMNCSSACTVTMQANSSATSKVFRVKKIGAGTVSISPNGSDTFFNVQSYASESLSDPGVSVELIPDGSSVWYVF